MADFYAILGVPPNATIEQIKDRYRFLAHAYHPDKFASETHKSQASETFKSINEAFQTLSDAGRRAEYDRQRTGAAEPPRPTPPDRSAPPEPSPFSQGPPEPHPPSKFGVSRESLAAKGALLLAAIIVVASALEITKLGSSETQKKTLQDRIAKTASQNTTPQPLPHWPNKITFPTTGHFAGREVEEIEAPPVPHKTAAPAIDWEREDVLTGPVVLPTKLSTGGKPSGGSLKKEESTNRSSPAPSSPKSSFQAKLDADFKGLGSFPRDDIARKVSSIAVRQWQHEAIAKYPDLGVEGSPFNTAFVAEYQRMQATDANFFNASNWPLTLANEVSKKVPIVKPLPPAPPAATTSFTIGSTKDEVLAIQGTPDSVSNYPDSFTYEYALVLFENGKVSSWSNRNGKLKVQLAPRSRVAVKDYFTIGSTKDEVLAIQGTPDSVSNYPDSFTYEYALVFFKNGKVSSWSNRNGKLKVQLAPGQ